MKLTFKILTLVLTLGAVWAIGNYRYKGSKEHISFQSGDVTLSGLLFKPKGLGPHPVVILLHGSGPLAADGPPVRIMANALYRSGIAVLTYDKRGVGSSGGTFHHNAYEDFIEDGINAVHYLSARDDVDADAIGLLGSSEGSIIAPEIAVRSQKVAFIIHRAGSAVDGIETNMWEKKHKLKRKGIPDTQLVDTIELREQIYRILVKADEDPTVVGSKEWQKVNDGIAKFNSSYSQDKVWIKRGERLGNNLADWGTFFGVVKSAMGYNPQPYIEQLDIPMLYIFAEQDENAPTAKSVNFLQGLQSRSEKDIDINVIAGVGHAMMTPVSFVLTGGYVPEFLDAIGPWASAKISAARSDLRTRAVSVLEDH